MGPSRRPLVYLACMTLKARGFRVTLATMGAPDVITYLDYRRFLHDWFEWKKTENARYSHRLFARRAGVRSPSLLLLVTEGKRNLTAVTTAGFCEAMGLDET
ncbi:MAG: TIGR02147 family protein, partial [Myxococcota bacterium]